MTTSSARAIRARLPVASTTQHLGLMPPGHGSDGASGLDAVLQSLVRPLCPAARTFSQPRVESDFSALAARPDTTTAGHAAERACPISPRRCPFGGACHSCPVRVQTKLTVNEPGDSYEQEAERIADQVMGMPEPRDAEKTENPGTTDIGVMSMQGQATDQADSTTAPPIVHEVLRSSGQPLDPATRAFMEPRFGYDFSQVRVHTDAQAAASAQAVGALAYTVGRDVVFGAGQYADGDRSGQRLLAHELTHVVQQGRTTGHALQRSPDILGHRVFFEPLPQCPPAARILSTASEQDIAAELYGDPWYPLTWASDEPDKLMIDNDALLDVWLTYFDESMPMPCPSIPMAVPPPEFTPVSEATSPDPCAGAPPLVAAALVGEGTEARPRTFGWRLTDEENRQWAALPEDCRRDPRQCPGEHSHRPSPRTPWSLSTLHGRIHAAMDIGRAPRGTPVYAPLRGEVLQAERTAGISGNVVMLLHRCPRPTEKFGRRPVTTIFDHLDSISPLSRSQIVEAGSQIGTVGDTGVPGHVHLHFSVQHVPESGRLPRRASSQYEERRDIQLRPGVWLREMGIAVSPAATLVRAETVEPAEAQPTETAPPVLQRHLDSRLDSWAPMQIWTGQARLFVQRKPAQVTAHTFLGLSVDGGVNPTMIRRLTAVANKLAVRFAAVHGRVPADAQELRAWAGVYAIRGWRNRSSSPDSKHCSGSAVDVNYENQPYIVTRTFSGSTPVYGGELLGSNLTAQRQAAVEVFDRAVEFVFGAGPSTDVSARREATGSAGRPSIRRPAVPADVSSRREATGSAPGETTNAVYQRFRRVSDALGIYLSLAFHSTSSIVSRRPIANIEDATEAQLLAAIPTSERKEQSVAVEDIRQYILGHPASRNPSDTTDHWNWEDSFSAEEYYFRMLRDYEHVRIPMERGNPAPRPGQTRNPARGFLDMTEEFVYAMTEVGGLRWGIADLDIHESGDTHHFDLGDHGGVHPDCSPGLAARRSDQRVNR